MMIKAVAVICSLIACVLGFGIVDRIEADGKKPPVIIHPLMNATVDIPSSVEMDKFMNGMTATCPEDTTPVDVKHLLHEAMSYKDTINAIAGMECQEVKK